MNDTTTLETVNSENTEVIDTCEFCQEQSDELAMDKLASVSYVAMMSVFAYALLALSVHFVA